MFIHGVYTAPKEAFRRIRVRKINGRPYSFGERGKGITMCVGNSFQALMSSIT